MDSWHEDYLILSLGSLHQPRLSYLWLADMKLTLSCLWGADRNLSHIIYG